MANDIITNLSSVDDLRSCLQILKPETIEGKQQAIKNIAEAFAYEKEHHDRATIKKMLESKYRSLIRQIKREQIPKKQMIFDKNKDEIRALSLKEPYASLMLYDKIETRTRLTSYRGWVLICASKVPYSDADIRSISGDEDYHRIYVTLDYYLDNHITDNLGKAIAIGYLSECRLMREADSKKCFVKFNRGIYCYVFEQVQPINPFYWRGSQGWKTLTFEQRQLIELAPLSTHNAVVESTKLTTKEEILENTTCCIIDEDADIDDVNNLYYQHQDVLNAMDKYADLFRQ